MCVHQNLNTDKFQFPLVTFAHTLPLFIKLMMPSLVSESDRLNIFFFFLKATIFS